MFRMFSQETRYEELILDDTNSIVGAKFIENAPIKMILHGYTGSIDNPLMQRLIIGKKKNSNDNSNNFHFIAQK